jgi:hypothetical protein
MRVRGVGAGASGQQGYRLKAAIGQAENHFMRLLVVLLASILGLSTGASASPLPRGNGDFRLGMARSQVDSAIAARGLTVISNGTAFLVCSSEDPTVEYEQYSFFRAPHGTDFLWKVTIGYRLGASKSDYATARERLRQLLGEPVTDSWQAGDDESSENSRPTPTSQRAVWADAAVAVQLGARWTDSSDPSADRMMVGWTDRKLQRLVEARRKKGQTAD